MSDEDDDFLTDFVEEWREILAKLRQQASTGDKD